MGKAIKMKIRRAQGAVVLLTILFITGCAQIVYDIPNEPVSHPQINKLNLRVGLSLSEELRRAKWERPGYGITVTVGETLTLNAEVMAHALFSSVVAVTNNTIEPVEARVEAVLTPRMVSFVRTQLASPHFGEQISTIILKWTLKDVKGNMIWVDTIAGEGRGKGTHRKAEEQIEALVEDLFQKSFQAISSSPEIREFAESRGS